MIQAAADPRRLEGLSGRKPDCRTVGAADFGHRLRVRSGEAPTRMPVEHSFHSHEARADIMSGVSAHPADRVCRGGTAVSMSLAKIEYSIFTASYTGYSGDQLQARRLARALPTLSCHGP